MPILTTLASLLAQPRPELSNDRYLRISWLLSPVAVLAAVLDMPVSTLVAGAVRWVVPGNLIPALSAPPALSMRNQDAAEYLLLTTISLVVAASVVIAVEERRSPAGAIQRADFLHGARILATAWLLITAAVQVGSLRTALTNLESAMAAQRAEMTGLLLVVALLLAIFALAVLAARRWDLAYSALNTCWRLARTPVRRLASGALTWTTTLMIATLSAVAWPSTYPVRLARWALGITPHSIEEARLAAAPDTPTGAAIEPLRGGF